MPRLGRLFLPDQPLHIVQRGNDRQRIFFRADDYTLYRHWLGEAAREYGLAIHAYVLMTNHVHLLATPARAESAARTLQSLGRRYVRHVNAAERRTGTLWEGRYRAAAIEGEAHFLTCMRYIELNPVRAGMVAHPRDYRWSSYVANADGGADPLLTEHALYRALGATPAERRRDYRALFRAALDPDFVDALRRATNGGWPLGEERFKRRLAKALGRRVSPRAPGRPPKQGADARQIKLL